MSRTFTLYLIMLVIVFASGCATVKPPAWTTGEIEPTYPNVRYMVGMADAADMTSAKDQARAEISKQFSVKVEQLVQTLQDYTGMEGKHGDTWILKTTVSELTKSFTGETIAGIQIRETWVNPETAHAYALAVLERNPAVMRLEQRVIDLDFDIGKRVDYSKAAADKLQKIRPLIQALELMKEREILNNQLTVVNASGQGISPRVSPAELNEELNKTLGSLNTAVELSGKPETIGRIRDAIVRSLGNGRLTVTPNGAECDLLVRGKVVSVETNQDSKTGFVFAKIRATLELVNSLDGRTFGVIEHELRDGALSWKDAQDKTLSRLAQIIVDDFNDKLYEYLSL